MNIKKIVLTKAAVILIALLCITGTLFAQVMGDVNGDNKVTILDALMTAQYTIGINLALFQPAQADVNTDGKIDVIDALLIAKYCVGEIASLPYVACYTLELTPSEWISHTGEDCFAPGTAVTLTALAEVHVTSPIPGTIIIGGDYYFAYWEDENGNKLSTELSIVITMNANRKIKAVYSQVW